MGNALTAPAPAWGGALQVSEQQPPAGPRTQAALADITAALRAYRPSHTVFEAEMAAPRRGEGAGAPYCIPGVGAGQGSGPRVEEARAGQRQSFGAWARDAPERQTSRAAVCLNHYSCHAHSCSANPCPVACTPMLLRPPPSPLQATLPSRAWRPLRRTSSRKSCARSAPRTALPSRRVGGHGGIDTGRAGSAFIPGWALLARATAAAQNAACMEGAGVEGWASKHIPRRWNPSSCCLPGPSCPRRPELPEYLVARVHACNSKPIPRSHH